jgi:hypothetical protein
MPQPTFEMLLMRMLTDWHFLDLFSSGGDDREKALQNIGFDPDDPNYQNIVDALNKIDYQSIKAAIGVMAHSSLLDPYLAKPAN